MEIKKDMTFREVMDNYPEAAEFFLERGMHCVGCPMSSGETIEEGCKGHGLDPDEVIKELKEKLKDKK